MGCTGSLEANVSLVQGNENIQPTKGRHGCLRGASYRIFSLHFKLQTLVPFDVAFHQSTILVLLSFLKKMTGINVFFLMQL